MDSITHTRRLLTKVKNRTMSVARALDELAELPFKDIGVATIDHHRVLRRGFPEVIFGEGKTLAQLKTIVRHFLDRRKPVVITRLPEQMFSDLNADIGLLEYDRDALMAYHLSGRPGRARGKNYIAVVTAGTSDYRVAREAVVTARLMGHRVRLIHDVGVAGVHRLFRHLRILRKAQVVIVVAGMEGALASVVSGLIARPVVAVPTSVGYGASFKGLAPLLTMMNSCSPGVSVVNIDNGFGAGYIASLINKN
ncbi:MAG: nickel pincer cofactor biosynthesis protein LarB [Candidatus Omnitrophica bacterium]|nr:nickel pincer cofactor biosynthesis protein LarB [Candidatus Omnitrophota bacterium]